MKSEAIRVETFRHVRAFFGAAVLVFAAVAAILADRRPPFEYLSSDISPEPAIEGQTVIISRNVIWHRQCDGEIAREVVKPGGQIVDYDKSYRPFPYAMGQQSAQSSFSLPPVMLGPDEPRGVAKYRGRVRFSRCGLTSRIVPIEIPFQELMFEVVRR